MSRDSERFTSTEGFNISTAGKSAREAGIAETLGRNILGFDVPEHTEFRAALMPAFNTQKLEQIEQVAEGFVGELLYGAVNHDPAVFEEPYRLRLDRKNARSHLAFGTGFHFCLGSRLAQMELRVALIALLKRFPNFEVAGTPRFMRNNFVSGMKSLPIVLRA